MPTTCTKVVVTGKFTGTSASGASQTENPWMYDSTQSKCKQGTITNEYFKVLCDPKDCTKVIVKEYDDAQCTNEQTSSSMAIKDIGNIVCGGSDEGCEAGQVCAKVAKSGVRGLRGIVIVGLMTVFIVTMSM